MDYIAIFIRQYLKLDVLDTRKQFFNIKRGYTKKFSSSFFYGLHCFLYLLAVTSDGHDIPGVKAAMTMDYSVRSPQDLVGLNPGDEITADIVVPENSNAYLEHIVVTKKGSGPAGPSGAD